MKLRFLLFFIGIGLLASLFSNCKKEEEEENNSTPAIEQTYRQSMRDFVQGISSYAKNINNNFIIIPQNGQELITDNGEGNGVPQTDYLSAIDATGRESMFFGYYNDDEITPSEDKNHLLELCITCEAHNVEVLATDYCSTHENMDMSYSLNAEHNFISFSADHRELDNIPDYPSPIHNENSNNITKISEAQNFLYLINGENYNSKQDLINAVSATNYDAIIIDLYHNETSYTADEIDALKIKNNGATRLVICYMSIGEAEDYRYYWQSEWTSNQPSWLEAENPEWEGNYKVKYWDKDWQAIIYGNDNSYLKKILDANFDGVYLDIIDGFEYFEEK